MSSGPDLAGGGGAGARTPWALLNPALYELVYKVAPHLHIHRFPEIFEIKTQVAKLFEIGPRF